MNSITGNIVTVLDLGMGSNRQGLTASDFINVIRCGMQQNHMRPASPEEMEAILQTQEHPGFDVVSLDGDSSSFVAVRKCRGDRPHQKLSLPAEEISGLFQWFAVVPRS